MTGWRITLESGIAFVVGPKAEARRRIAACGDTSPPWVKRRNAWATSPTVARRVLDQLDARQVSYALDDTSQLGLDLSATEPANSVSGERQESLW